MLILLSKGYDISKKIVFCTPLHKLSYFKNQSACITEEISSRKDNNLDTYMELTKNYIDLCDKENMLVPRNIRYHYNHIKNYSDDDKFNELYVTITCAASKYNTLN
jgi:hypothetical protein